MVRLMSRGAIVASILGLALASPAAVGPAFAQAGAMPMPPSANDPPPKNNAATPRKPARAPAKKKRETSVSDPFGGGTNAPRPSYTDRIDTRPARGELQLEDDPRVTPTLEGGRPGLGMKF